MSSSLPSSTKKASNRRTASSRNILPRPKNRTTQIWKPISMCFSNNEGENPDEVSQARARLRPGVSMLISSWSVVWPARHLTVKLLILSVSLLIITELYLRSAGFSSYPIYDVGDDIKYIPSANQNGKFLNTNAWYFNDRHMGNIPNWSADKHPNIVLVGNSIVLGGNPFRHSDKLGPLLEKNLGAPYTVWSVAAGGWTNVNELAYLDHNTDVLENADAVIIEFMEGGLSTFAPWPGYYVFPGSKPWVLTGYIFYKYVVTNQSGEF